ncbi:MAG: hypothetical protein WBK19_10460 [Azonexus sp.]
MNAHYLTKERDRIKDRLQFIDALLDSTKPDPKPDDPYECQQYDATRLCRFDRRALDRKCDGCPRTTDRDYLESQGLWVPGVAYEVTE